MNSQNPSPHFKILNKLLEVKEPRSYRTRTPELPRTRLKSMVEARGNNDISGVSEINVTGTVGDASPNRVESHSQRYRGEKQIEEPLRAHSYRKNYTPPPELESGFREPMNMQESSSVFQHRFRRFKPSIANPVV